MSGEQESEKPKDHPMVERMRLVQQKLDEYEVSKGLRKIQANDAADKYIQMGEDEINKLTADECGAGSFLLEQRAYFIQKELNREEATATWAQDTLESMLIKKLDNYKSYFKDDLKMKAAIQDDDAAKKLDAIRSYAKQRAARLQFLANRLSSMANRLDSLQQTKRRHRYES